MGHPAARSVLQRPAAPGLVDWGLVLAVGVHLVARVVVDLVQALPAVDGVPAAVAVREYLVVAAVREDAVVRAPADDATAVLVSAYLVVAAAADRVLDRAPLPVDPVPPIGGLDLRAGAGGQP